ncbi:hypothetical protein COBT_001855 [Conglomerata obtusa]
MIRSTCTIIFNTFVYLFFYRAACEIYKFLLSRLKNRKLLRSVKDKWIMITGATDGIGKALAIELSKKKCKLILVGRDQEKLDDVKSICRNGSAECVILKINFSDQINFGGLFTEYDIGMLINNVGCCSNGPHDFIDDEQMENIVHVNVTNTLKLTKEILQKMIKQKKGYIVNIGSSTGDFPVPYLATYGASKAFIKAWSESLNLEAKAYGVNVECMNTGYVCTKMSKIRKSSYFIPTPEIYAKCILKHFGSSDVSFAYFPHLLQSLIISFVPKSLFSYFVLKLQSKKKEKAYQKLRLQAKVS